jgi:glycosyltransferase involved in cell wall biosynthesis
MKPPAVSVVIPTFRRSAMIRETLDSVFAQSFADFEVVVVDDGSPDDTRERLAPLARAGKIRYLEQSNQGRGGACNRGIAEARGEFLALLDDDDLWPADKLAWQVEVLRGAPGAALVFGFARPFRAGGLGEVPMEFVDPRNRHEIPPSGRVSRSFLWRNWISAPGLTLMRLHAVKAAGGLDTSLWPADDYDLYVRLAERGEFIYRDACALYYRKHRANASNSLAHMYESLRRVHAKHLNGRPGFDPLWLRLRAAWYHRRSFYEQYYRLAGEELAQGRLAEAQLALRQGVRLYPWARRRWSYWRLGADLRAAERQKALGPL